ncbi:MAG TPA: hypothetical protein VGG61_11745 [Gemmataceae bacterium]|jgi:hypothetical protein
MMLATKTSQARLSAPPWLRWAGFLLLSGYLLFNHGCHGDEDNELFAALRAAVGR